MTQAAARYLRDEAALWRRSANAVVILPAGSSEAFTLRGSGSALWDALAVPSTFEEIVGRLAAAHDIDTETVAAQLEPVIRDLVNREAVHES